MRPNWSFDMSRQLSVQMQRRRKGKKEKGTLPTVKHREGWVLFHGCFAASGTGCLGSLWREVCYPGPESMGQGSPNHTKVQISQGLRRPQEPWPLTWALESAPFKSETAGSAERADRKCLQTHRQLVAWHGNRSTCIVLCVQAWSQIADSQNTSLSSCISFQKQLFVFLNNHVEPHFKSNVWLIFCYFQIITYVGVFGAGTLLNCYSVKKKQQTKNKNHCIAIRNLTLLWFCCWVLWSWHSHVFLRPHWSNSWTTRRESFATFVLLLGILMTFLELSAVRGFLKVKYLLSDILGKTVVFLFVSAVQTWLHIKLWVVIWFHLLINGCREPVTEQSHMKG